MRFYSIAPLVGAFVALVCAPACLALPLNSTDLLSSSSIGSDSLLLARANPSFPDPSVDPFYQPSSSFAGATNGQVLKRRKADTVILSPNLDASYQLQYRTTDTQGAPVTTIATIFVPRNPDPAQKILSIQWYEDSVSFNCAPSWALIANSGSANAIVSLLDINILTQLALAKGWYVVQADHEGPKSSFIAGFNSGQAVLDGIRALINDQKLRRDAPIALTGYSGGAHATVWAETLAESYAPELNLIASAHGGTPVDPKTTLELINGSFFAGFAFSGLIGMMSQYPDLKNYIDFILTPSGRSKVDQFTGGGYCLPSVAIGSAFQNIFSFTTVPNALDDPRAVKTLKAESLLMDYSSNHIAVPKFPRFIYHGLVDQIVPYGPAKKYVDQQCDQGADIQFLALPAEHVTGQLQGLAPTIVFLDLAFGGKIPQVKCGSILPDLKGIGLDSPKMEEVMGKDLAQQARGLRGKSSPYGGRPF